MVPIPDTFGSFYRDCEAEEMRVLDLFCGRFGWGRAFAYRGHQVLGVDLVEPPEIPENCKFLKRDILCWHLGWDWERFAGQFDFICASSPCENFSVHGMKHFHPNPPYPEMGIRLFNHTRSLCEASGKPYVMENVRPAQHFVGNAVHRFGPFYLWGNAVPPLIPKAGIVSKGIDVGSSKIIKQMTPEERREYRKQFVWNQAWSSSKQRKRDTAKAATIPPELANCVCDYAERLLEMRATA